MGAKRRIKKLLAETDAALAKSKAALDTLAATVRKIKKHSRKSEKLLAATKKPRKGKSK
jgi:hypothetical protein